MMEINNMNQVEAIVLSHMTYRKKKIFTMKLYSVPITEALCSTHFLTFARYITLSAFSLDIVLFLFVAYYCLSWRTYDYPSYIFSFYTN
jgi:hypothetical protein